MKCFIVPLAVLVLSACEDSSVDPANAGEVENRHGNITNLDAFFRFVDNVQQGRPDNIRITMYTIEGDPIYYHLNYDGQTIKYTYDNSEDAYGPNDKGKKNTTCEKFETNKTEKGTAYQLKGCASEVGNTFYFVVE